MKEKELEQALQDIEEYINDTDIIKTGYSFRIDDMRFFENIEKIINKAKGDSKLEEREDYKQALLDIEEYIEDNCKDYFENENKPSYIIDDKQTRYILEIINKALGEDKL